MVRPLSLGLLLGAAAGAASQAPSNSSALTDAAGLTPAGRQILRIVITVCATLSISGSLFIVVCFFYLKRTQQVALRLVVCLSVLDVLSHLGTYMEMATSPSVCAFAGWWSMMFDLCPILWTTCISFHLYFSIFKGKRGKRAFLGYFAYALGVPFILSLLGFAFSKYGDAGDVCWLISPLARVILFYLPLWLCVAYNGVKYILITREFTRIFRRHNLHQSSPQLHRLKAYPMVLVVCWTFASIHRVMNIVWPHVTFPFWLFVLHFGLCKLQGFFNALVYGMDPFLLKELKHKCLGTASPWEPQQDEAALAAAAMLDQWPGLPPDPTTVGPEDVAANPAPLVANPDSKRGEEEAFQEVRL